MVKKTWKDMLREHPVEADLLMQEYEGFASGPCDCEFEVWLDGTIRATDPAFHDPWTWDPRLEAWLS